MQVQTSPAEARHGARGERKGTLASIFLTLRLTSDHRGRNTLAHTHTHTHTFSEASQRRESKNTRGEREKKSGEKWGSSLSSFFF